MGNSNSVPTTEQIEEEKRRAAALRAAELEAAQHKAAAEELRRNQLRERQEVRRDLEEARAKAETVMKAHTDELRRIGEERRMQEEHHGREQVRRMMESTEKVEQIRQEMTDKITDVKKETKEHVRTLERAFMETMENDLAFIQSVPSSIAADKESQLLIPLMEAIRENLSQIHGEYAKFCETQNFKSLVHVVNGTEDADASLESALMSLCERGRTLRTNLLTQLAATQSIDFRLRETTRIALNDMQKLSNALFQMLFLLQNRKEPISVDDLTAVHNHITQMEEIIANIPELQGPTTSERAQQALREHYARDYARREAIERARGETEEEEEERRDEGVDDEAAGPSTSSAPTGASTLEVKFYPRWSIVSNYFCHCLAAGLCYFKETAKPAYDEDQSRNLATLGMSYTASSPTEAGRLAADAVRAHKKREQWWEQRNAEIIAQQHQIEEDIYKEEMQLKLEIEERSRAIEEERRKEEEEEQRRQEQAREEKEAWEVSLRSLGMEHEKVRKEYSMMALTWGDDEVARIEENSKMAMVLFDHAVIDAKDSITREFEDHRRMRGVQMVKLFQLLRNEMWSKQAEAQLSSRLFSLRNSHEPVRHRFVNVSTHIVAAVHNQGSSNQASYCQAISELALLKDELRGEITTMNDEVADMQEIKDAYPQAYFLTDIQESAQRVADAAIILLSKIKGAEDDLKSSPDQTINISTMDDCQQCFEELEKQVEAIPTLEELRDKYL